MKNLIYSIVSLCVGCFCLSLQAQSGQVKLYPDCNYRGNYRSLVPGEYSAYRLGVGNDNLSSVFVPDGLRVILFRDNNFRGESFTLEKSERCLPPQWNNSVSSVIIEQTRGYGYTYNRPSYNNNPPAYGGMNYDSRGPMITIYKDCGFKGGSTELGPGEWRDYDLGWFVGNDQISSIRIPQGLEVTLFMDDQFRGESTTLTGDVECLSGRWDNAVSSVIVKQTNRYNNNNYGGNYNNNYNTNYGYSGPRVTVYSDCSYRGRSNQLAPGDYLDYELGIGNDNLSSIRVPRGLRVTIYQDNRYTGPSMTLERDEDCFSNYWNNRVSSIRIEETGSTGYYTTRPGTGYNTGGYNSGRYNSGGYNNSNRYTGDPNEAVTLYDDCGFRGRSTMLGPGKYGDSELGIGNDALSSIRVPRGMRVILYTDNRQRGQSTTLTADDRCLSGDWNNKVSSIVVEKAGYGSPSRGDYDLNEVVTVYTECGYQGRSHNLPPGEYGDRDMGIGNDIMSSIRIPKGFQVILYTDNRQRGQSITLRASDRCFSGQWNNNVSSMVVQREGK